MFDLFFLEADEPLTKRFSLDASSNIIKTPYPNAYNFTSHKEHITTVGEFYAAIKKHAAKDHCLIKGQLHRNLDYESRAGATKTEDTTHWMVLDFDGLTGWKSVSTFMDEHPDLSDVSYVVQYSASSGIANTKGLRAHVFIILSHPYHAPYLKGWMTKQNVDGELFKGKIVGQLTLTRTGSALHYPLDITINQNDKLIYIAEPIIDKGVKYRKPDGGFVQLVTKKIHALPIERLAHGTPAKWKAEADKRFTLLRKEAKLEPVRGKSRMLGGFEVMPDVGEFVVTGTKDERGFRYFNFNGGDSWAYYHPLNNHEFIHSFKADTTYQTKRILPSYYKQMEREKRDGRADKLEDGTTLLAFRDIKADTYYNGTWNAKDQELIIHQTKQRAALADFLAQRGSGLGDFIPDWNVEFNPRNPTVCDPENRYLNLYVPTPYQRAQRGTFTGDLSKCPTIQKIILSAVSGNQYNEVTEHFLNWLAVIFQHKIKTITGWVLHGTEGTGKGLLADEILTPLLGDRHVVTRRFSELEQQWTGWLEPALIAVIDEIQVSASKRKDLITSDLKNFVTSPRPTYRNMNKMSYQAASYVNFLLFSNMPDPVVISDNDRRFNVGDFQTKRLMFNVTDIVPTLKKELPFFMDYIMQRPADIAKARELIHNDARKQVIKANRNTLDIMCEALLEGDISPFVDAMPDTKMLAEIAGASSALGVQYSNIVQREMRAVVESKPDKDGFIRHESRLSRDEIYVLLQFTIGSLDPSPSKFTRVLSHKRIELRKVRINDKPVMGIEVAWVVSPEWVEANITVETTTTPARQTVIPMKGRKKA